MSAENGRAGNPQVLALAESYACHSMKSITSRDNPFFKKMIKLEGSAHQRKMTGLTLLDGIHLIAALLYCAGAAGSPIMSESGTGKRGNKTPAGGRREPREGPDVFMLSDSLFREFLLSRLPTGIMALVSIPLSSAISNKP